MTINNFINETLKKTKKPFGFLKYNGKVKEYLTYAYSVKPGLFSDDDNEGKIYEVSITVFSDKNYLSLIDELIKTMKKAGFIWTDSGVDMFDDETGLYYKTLYFEIERCEF